MTGPIVEPRPDAMALFARKWRTVAIWGAVGLAGGVVYGLLAPNWYSATLSVVPSRSQDPTGGLAAKLPSIGGLDAGLAIDVQRIHAVLSSISVADAVIDKFDLMDRYDTEFRELARKALAEHCVASADKKSSLVTLTCEDKDPSQAMAMTAYFGEVGNKVFGRVTSSSAREERRFLESQVVKSRKDVDGASQKLRAFQEAHRVVDLPEQSKAVISAMASIKGQLISKQLELTYLRGFSGRAESSVVQLEQQIAILQSKLDQLESQTSQTSREPASPAPAGSGAATAVDNHSFFPGAMSVPELRFELEQLVREQKIQETVFFMTTQRYEMAKVDEARDTSTFQILDYPTLPTYKTRPTRIRICVLGILGGVGFSGVWIMLPAWWRRRNAAVR